MSQNFSCECSTGDIQEVMTYQLVHNVHLDDQEVTIFFLFIVSNNYLG